MLFTLAVIASVAAGLICLLLAPEMLIRLSLPLVLVILGWYVAGSAGFLIMAAGVGLAAVLWRTHRKKTGRDSHRDEVWDLLLEAPGPRLLPEPEAEMPFSGGDGGFGGGGAAGSWSDTGGDLELVDD